MTDLTKYGTTVGDGTFGQYNPETGTYDYDPNNLPEPEDGKIGFRTVGVARIGIELRLPNGNTVTANPDDYIASMVVENPDHSVKTISGRLRTVCGSSRYQNFMPRFYNPRGPQLSDYILPQMLVVDSSEAHKSTLNYVPIMSILSVGEIQSAETLGVIVVGPGPQYAPLSTVIENADEGSVIELLSGDYYDDLHINKSLSIVAKGSVTLHGSITIGTEGDTKKLEVELSGLDMTDNARIVVNHATSVTVDNCVFKMLNFSDDSNDQSTVIDMKADEKTFVCISNNTFKTTDGIIPRSIIQVFPQMTELSKIVNNRFERDCCTGNTIILYGLDRNGDVEVSHNYCEQSRNMLVIRFRGIVNGRIAIVDNTYETTTSDVKYAGLVCVEPYLDETKDMHMLDISISDTKNFTGSDQIVYLYSAQGDAILDETTRPTIYIDGYFKPVPYVKD